MHIFLNQPCVGTLKHFAGCVCGASLPSPQAGYVANNFSVANEKCVMAFIKLYSHSHPPLLIVCRQVQSELVEEFVKLDYVRLISFGPVKS